MARSGVLNVYIEDVSPRARWIFSLVLEELLGLKLNLTADPSPVQNMLNYSEREIPGAVSIVPSGLLEEEGLRKQEIKITEYKGIKTFFHVDGGDLPFDLFSMAFYMVSRYEEYLPFEADSHGRFPHTESLAFREGFHDKAVVNRLALLLKAMLKEKFSELEFNMPEYSFTPTVDVDIAYAHLGKGLVRTYGSMARLMLQGKAAEVSRRIKSMQGKTDDPYDNYDFMLESFAKYDLTPVFFILAGTRGPYDRNLSTRNTLFATLLKNLALKVELGIHPSYDAGPDAERIKYEIGRLEKASQSTVSRSRQHFIRMSMPATYEALISAGIKQDYSMGYASIIGFRAGIASSYNFYNLRKEEESSLRIHPFAFMDTTLSDYMGLKPEDYLDAVLPLIRETQEVSATMTGIWHNYALADDAKKHKAFDDIIKLASVK